VRTTNAWRLAVAVLLGLDVGSAAAGPFLLPVVEQVIRDGVGGIDSLDGLSDAALAPGGEHLYVTAAVDDALTVFARGSVNDSFVLVEVEGPHQGGRLRNWH
jgi:hypothetical protein